MKEEQPPMREVVKTEDEWRAQLTDQEYHVLREKGTERAFTGEYWETTTPGKYRCRACDAELFRSDTKFDAHCGWPSFSEPSVSDNVEEHVDTTHGMVRTAVSYTHLTLPTKA